MKVTQALMAMLELADGNVLTVRLLSQSSHHILAISLLAKVMK